MPRLFFQHKESKLLSKSVFYTIFTEIFQQHIDRNDFLPLPYLPVLQVFLHFKSRGRFPIPVLWDLLFRGSPHFRLSDFVFYR